MKMKLFLFSISSLMVVLVAAQNVGIGTTTPLARLHVTDSAVLFSGSVLIPSSGTTINPPVQGPGTRMMWFPALGAFRTGFVDGTQWNKNNIGLLSFAAGNNTTASGDFSTSMGRYSSAINAVATSMGFGTYASGEVATSIGNGTEASGFSATSMGASTIASGDYSTALGQSNTASGLVATATGKSTSASGNYSLSTGENTFAKARGSFTTGIWNDDSDNPNNNLTAPTDRIFQIGNGTTSTRSNALTILRNGNVGIGIIDPLFKLDLKGRIFLRGDGNLSNSPAVAFSNINGDEYRGATGMQTDSLIGLYGIGNNMPNNGWGLTMNVYTGRVGIGTNNAKAALHVADSSVVFAAAGVSGSEELPPISGEGRRMMWYPPRAAFRTGYVEDVNWDKDSIGSFSFASGYNTKATEHSSTATGYGSIAAGYTSTAMGYRTTASGTASTTMGSFTTATGGASVAMGYFTNAVGFNSVAMGHFTISSGDNSIAMGSVTTASGENSTAIGLFTKAKSQNSLAIGSYNDSTATNRLFEIGNGTADNARSNAITVLQNGNTGIKNIDPAYSLDVSNRMRLRSGGDLNNSAGIFLNNTNNSDIPAFIGMQSNNHVGFYGNSSGWSFVMNTTNGNIGMGTATPSSSLEVNGFTKLGSDAPAIKVKKLTGTTASADGGNVNIPHGLVRSQILSVSVLVESGLNTYTPPSTTIYTGVEYNFDIYTNTIWIYNIPGNSGSILSKPFKILITYEE